MHLFTPLFVVALLALGAVFFFPFDAPPESHNQPLEMREETVVVGQPTATPVQTKEEPAPAVIPPPQTEVETRSEPEPQQPPPAEDVVVWKSGVATVFWVGEPAGPDNGHIANHASAFDIKWEQHFGGFDDPNNRCGFLPCTFVPNENPFYIALPYTDRAHGKLKENAYNIPWYSPEITGSLIKNRWVAVRANNTTCYGQWEDVGPFETDDFAYVFGDAQIPQNTRGAEAGIDLSPALRDCLGVGGIATVEWRFVEDTDVPSGPWLSIVTTD